MSPGRPTPKKASLPRPSLNGGSSDRNRAKAIRDRTPSRKAGELAAPPRSSNRSSRLQILEAARRISAERGYLNASLHEITGEVGITHQGFYGHFANKRHAVALATSEGLGAIAEIANRGLKQNEPWAERIVAEIDNALAEAYPAADGPERRIMELLISEIPSRGFEAIRIAELVSASGIGQQEFYRRYGGRIGCLRRIYAELLEQLGMELADAEGDVSPLGRLGELLAGDNERTKLLAIGASHLPEGPEQPRAATQSSLPAFVVEVLGGDGDPHRRALAWGALELIRSAVLADRVERLAADLAGLERSWGGASAVEPLAA